MIEHGNKARYAGRKRYTRSDGSGGSGSWSSDFLRCVLCSAWDLGSVLPLWLESRGLSASSVGVILATGFWTQVAFEPLIGRVADRTPRFRSLIFASLTIAVGGYILFSWASALWGYVLLAAVVGATFPVVLPLLESLAVRSATREGVNYGRLRLWGSLAFVAASLAVGRALEATGSSWIIIFLIASLSLTALASRVLPSLPTERTMRHHASPRRLGQHYAWFVVAACLAQASHATFYGFSSIHWRSMGHSETWIGGFWAIGVAAEVLLFLAPPLIVRRSDPIALVAIGAVGGIVRWTVLMWATHAAVILAAQTLHAVSFGVTQPRHDEVHGNAGSGTSFVDRDGDLHRKPCRPRHGRAAASGRRRVRRLWRRRFPHVHGGELRGALCCARGRRKTGRNWVPLSSRKASAPESLA